MRVGLRSLELVLSSFPWAPFPGVGAFGVQGLSIWAQKVFLLFSPEGGGGWSTRGCSVSSSQEDLTTCACNHTTNFAVLLQIYEVQVRRGLGLGRVSSPFMEKDTSWGALVEPWGEAMEGGSLFGWSRILLGSFSRSLLFPSPWMQNLMAQELNWSIARKLLRCTLPSSGCLCFLQRSLEEETTLKTLTFVGCGVSFCALIVTLVLFLAVG